MNNLRELAEKATTGPWVSYCPYGGTVYIEAVIRPGVIQEVAAIGPTETPMQQPSNAAYIAAASPDVILSVLDRQDRLEALLREANEVIDQRNAELSRLKSRTITHDEWYEQCNDITRKDGLLLKAVQTLNAHTLQTRPIYDTLEMIVEIEKELA